MTLPGAVSGDILAFLPPRGDGPKGDLKMEIADEEFMTDGSEQADDSVLKEAWPVPSEESLEEFIGYLMDLDLRF